MSKIYFMSGRNLLYLFIVLVPLKIIGQRKILSYNQVQSRNELQEWGKIEKISNQTAEFTADKIKLKIDKDYKLTILSKTNLPDKGIIYLCKDEKSNPITVMLIDDIKMYLYAKSKRFLINFKQSSSIFQLADID
jgi:hypothetical protein